jgi:hypothetical protein
MDVLIISFCLQQNNGYINGHGIATVGCHKVTSWSVQSPLTAAVESSVIQLRKFAVVGSAVNV